MASYQDIETKIAVLEDKVEFIMKAFTLKTPPVVIGGEPKFQTLLQKYYEAKSVGMKEALKRLEEAAGTAPPAAPSNLVVEAN